MKSMVKGRQGAGAEKPNEINGAPAALRRLQM